MPKNQLNHNHPTRDIKPYGECNGCDEYHLKNKLEQTHHIVLNSIYELDCPESYGYEGPGTFLDCGRCVVCFTKSILDKRKVEDVEKSF